MADDGAHYYFTDRKLGIIGRDRVMVEKVARRLWLASQKLGDYSQMREDRRGNEWELRLEDGRIVKVVVTLDRIEEDRPGDEG